MFLLDFKEWFLLENTVSQSLKSYQYPDVVKDNIIGAMTYLSKQAWARTISQDKLMWLAKWSVYQYVYKYVQPSSNIDNIKDKNGDFMRYIINNQVNDYLSAMFMNSFDIIKGKLNNPNYSLEELKKDSKEWHNQITYKKRIKGPEGRTLKLEGMFPGWYWVSLDKGYCKIEGDAMGHCGNAGRREGDNIYSLRDAKGIPHLTFIVNNGVLGESKGYSNQKPSQKYHSMIIALLLGKDNGKDIVEHIRGGGYLSENNFQFSNLSKQEQELVLKQKPHIIDYFEFIKNRSKNNPELAKKTIEDDVNFKFENIDFNNGIAIIKSWDDIQGMIEWLKYNTNSDVKEIPDFDDFTKWNYGHFDTTNAIEEFEYNANSKNKELIDEIIKRLKYDIIEDKDEDYDVKWATENDDEVDNALKNAANDADAYGAQGEAYRHVVDYFNKESTYEGFQTIQTEDKRWQLRVKIKDLIKLYNFDIDDEQNLGNLISFKYEQPYNGYEGFDKEIYNEKLFELLNEILENLKK